MAEAQSQAGKVLKERYRLDAPLGSGGFGTIWRAMDLRLAAPVAVKLIDPEIAKDAGAVERFMREAHAAAALRSPHVVQIIDYAVEDDLPFMVMELLEGENLAQRLKRVGKLSPLETARLLSHVARAVGKAHEVGIVHRDLKPENVFIVHNEDDEVAKVLDFGVAKVESGGFVASGARTRTGSLLGTPYYMSPEQVQGNKEVDFRSDLWALGVIAFEALTGRKPFQSDGLGDLVLQICVRRHPVPSETAPVPPMFDPWFAKATAREPNERFQSARELATALREVLGAGDRETIVTVTEDSDRPDPAARTNPAPPMAPSPPLDDGADAPFEPHPEFQVGAHATGPFDDTQALRPSEAPHRSYFVLVAAMALLVGVGGVLLWTQKHPQWLLPGGRGTHSAPRSAPDRVPSQPKKRVDDARVAPAAMSPLLVRDASVPTPSVDASRAAAREYTSTDADVRRPDAGVQDAAADAPWVKPDWAKPDEVIRSPDDIDLEPSGESPAPLEGRQVPGAMSEENPY
ncbi:MAG: serine/threonine protein kinase [Polyangiaceae bacterium]|nr:serine/threonine protein kinase [Polyangiaceae bacterium]